MRVSYFLISQLRWKVVASVWKGLTIIIPWKLVTRTLCHFCWNARRKPVSLQESTEEVDPPSSCHRSMDTQPLMAAIRWFFSFWPLTGTLFTCLRSTWNSSKEIPVQNFQRNLNPGQDNVTHMFTRACFKAGITHTFVSTSLIAERQTH